MESQKDISSLCRIKVNKMLNSLNSNKNIFIPKYTILSKNEEKYSYLKPKGNSFKTNHNKKSQNLNLKMKISKSNISTTEENYNNQPIDFLIDHGVLIYQRDFKGEEVINLGINNEYLRKNKFNMIKNDNTIYQTESNFRPKKHNNNSSIINKSSKQSWTNQKKLKPNNSKKTLISTCDIPLIRMKNSSSRQKKIHSTNLNTTQNSISSINSISVKTFLASSKNKNENNKNNKSNINSNLNIKSAKKAINFIRKKNNNNNNQNKYLILKKRKNYSGFCKNDEEKVIINNKTEIKDNYIVPNIKDIKYKINYETNKNKKIEEKKIVFIINENNNQNNFNNSKSDIRLKITKLFINIDNILKYYLKYYFQILMDFSLEKNLYKTEYKNDIINNNQKMKIEKIEINRIISDKSKQNQNYKNNFNNKEHKKSNSIIVNKKISSITTSTKELQKNNSNKNLNILISKNLIFFSNDKNEIKKNDPGKSELYRDSKSLQKKYEQICRRKKRQLTMTFPIRIK